MASCRLIDLTPTSLPGSVDKPLPTVLNLVIVNMFKQLAALSSLLVLGTNAQQVGTQKTETHPSMTWSKCSGTGGTSCTNQQGKIVVDANWRWVHDKNGYTNCE